MLTGRRSEQLPPHHFYIDLDVLVGCLGLFEVPSADEGAAIVSVDTDKGELRHDVH